jgi:hypothetical protein
MKPFGVAKLQQLLIRNHPVLSRGKRRQLPVLSHFASHIECKCDSSLGSPPFTGCGRISPRYAETNATAEGEHLFACVESAQWLPLSGSSSPVRVSTI